MLRAVLAAAVVAALGLALGGAPASAGDSVWEEAARDPEAQRIRDEYAKAMLDGDEAAMLAATTGNAKRQERGVKRAALAYERAAAIDPTAAEPHWRAANVLFGFFLQCDPQEPLCARGAVEPLLYDRVIGHWDAFEARAPKDPRITGILFERAILRTKLGTREHVLAAIEDYEALIDRQNRTDAVWLGNLAESYMMVGRLDDAIATYQAAYRHSSEVSIAYGLAVAYDRDGQGEKARELIVALGDAGYVTWSSGVDSGNTFYVPDGEVHYYHALALEALGHDVAAAFHWREYVASGAHPEHHARARTHLAAIAARQKNAANHGPKDGKANDGRASDGSAPRRSRRRR